jgi:hypothetical protein
MSRIAGPFAGQVAPNGSQMAPLYGSQAGATPHMLQSIAALPRPGTGVNVAQAPMPSGNAMGPGATGAEKQPKPKSGDKADAPDADVSEPIWEMLIGSCAGGAFIGGFSAATAVVPVGVAVAAAPVVTSAMAIGCGLGVATAVVSYGAVLGYQRMVR